MVTKNNEHGTTMIETIMCISLLIVVGTSIARGVVSVFNRYKTGRLAQQVIDLKRAILAYTAINEDYTSLSEQAMINADALPIDLKALRHAMNGKIEFGPTTTLSSAQNASDSNNKYMFYVTFHSLRQEACIELLTQGQFFTDGAEMDSLQVNDNYCWQYPYSLFKFNSCGYSTTLSKQHLELKDGLRGCKNKDSNKITWIFS